MDELIVFHSLTEPEIQRIAELLLRQVAGRLEEQEIHLTWEQNVVEKLAEDGYDPKFGARPLRRLIQRTVEDTLSEELLKGEIALGQEVRMVLREGEIAVEAVPVAQEQEAAAPAENDAEERDSLG